MKSEQKFSQSDLLKELMSAEQGRALILVPWLWSPEKELLSHIRKQKEVVDLTRKLINYLIPIKGEGRYITSRTSFNPSNSDKIFMINCAKLPFISIKRVYMFLAVLGFREEQIDIVFLFRSDIEARNLNRESVKKYSDFSILDNHVYSANQLRDFLFTNINLIITSAAELTGNAEIILTDDFLTKVINDVDGKLLVKKDNHPYPVIHLKRRGMKYPADALHYWVAEFVKEFSPYTLENEMYRLGKSPEEIDGEVEIIRKATDARYLSVRRVDEKDAPIHKTEEEQYRLDQNLLAAELKLQEVIPVLNGRYPVQESDSHRFSFDSLWDCW